MGECLHTKTAAAPCCVCGEYQSESVHIVNLKFYCGKHCPQHKPAEPLEGDVPTIAGKQTTLF